MKIKCILSIFLLFLLKESISQTDSLKMNITPSIYSNFNEIDSLVYFSDSLLNDEIYLFTDSYNSTKLKIKGDDYWFIINSSKSYSEIFSKTDSVFVKYELKDGEVSKIIKKENTKYLEIKLNKNNIDEIFTCDYATCNECYLLKFYNNKIVKTFYLPFRCMQKTDTKYFDGDCQLRKGIRVRVIG